MNTLFPIYIKQERLKVLLLGGGRIALEKLNTLLYNSPEAEIVVLADRFCESISDLAVGKPNVTLILDKYVETYLDGFNLIILGTSNRKLNFEAAEDARKKNILVNAADMPEYCDFYLGAVVRKGNLKIGISTNGKSPLMAVRLREFLEHALPNELDELIADLEQIRAKLQPDLKTRVERLKEITSGFVHN